MFTAEDGRAIQVGDYVTWINELYRRIHGEKYRTDILKVTSIDPSGPWIRVEGKDTGYLSSCFRVVSTSLPPTTVRDMSYHILRQLEKA